MEKIKFTPETEKGAEAERQKTLGMAKAEAEHRGEQASWFRRLFAKDTPMDIMHERALQENQERDLDSMEHLNYSEDFKKKAKGQIVEGGQIFGKYNGHDIRLTKARHRGERGHNLNGTIDGQELSREEAEQIYNKLYPLLMVKMKAQDREEERRALSGEYLGYKGKGENAPEN